MNERIRELIERATVRGEEYLPGNDGHPTPTVYFDKEKFAELIVQECSQMVVNSHPDDLPFVGGKMLVHFGVEE
jgi:hypothetical protein